MTLPRKRTHLARPAWCRWTAAFAIPLLPLLSACGERAATPPGGAQLPAVVVAVAPVTRQAINRAVVASGMVVPREELLITSELPSGRIAQVNVDEGMRVKAGQQLIQLDTALIDAQLRQADAARERADAAVPQTEAAFEEARALREEAEANLKRGEAVAGTGAISAEAMEQRRTAARVAIARARAAEQSAKVAVADRRAATAQAEEAATRKRLATLVAPADGLVTERRARVGANVAGSAEPLLRIAKDGLLEIEAEVSETQQAAFPQGARVEVVIGDAVTTTGTVRVAGGRVAREDRLARIRVALSADARAVTGQVARVRAMPPASGVLTVPDVALLFEGTTATVYVVDGEVAKRRPVVTGARGNGVIEVKEGLNENELVVTVGAAYLRDGERVRLERPAAPAPATKAAPAAPATKAAPAKAPA